MRDRKFLQAVLLQQLGHEGVQCAARDMRCTRVSHGPGAHRSRSEQRSPGGHPTPWAPGPHVQVMVARPAGSRQARSTSA